VPFLKTVVRTTEVEQIESEPGGKTIGQIIDDRLSQMTQDLQKVGEASVESIEFGFEDPDDWHRYINGVPSRRSGKAKASDY